MSYSKVELNLGLVRDKTFWEGLILTKLLTFALHIK